MQMAFHLGVHGTDGDRLLKTLLNNRDWLMQHGTDIITPNRHRGLFEEALMSLKGGRATAEMQQIMLDAVLHSDDPDRAVFSTPTFMGAPGRVVGQTGLYPQMGARAAALANLFPDHEVEFFLAIRHPDRRGSADLYRRRLSRADAGAPSAGSAVARSDPGVAAGGAGPPRGDLVSRGRAADLARDRAPAG
ncbi:hypothetical protein [Paracoccus sp. 22332]|uniref:hypothetical protein n=1 Tax=Paracoccus sp. 22332 TaxID=3453913 RepID=UPI003F85CC42